MAIEQFTSSAPEQNESPEVVTEEQKEAALLKVKKLKLKAVLQPIMMKQLGYVLKTIDTHKSNDRAMLWKDHFFAEDFAQACDETLSLHPEFVDEYEAHPEKVINVVKQKMLDIHALAEAE
ncbi:MAG: hypothetical protein M3Q73_01540 [bacterium]|nr:hypothetical protein [bacterium]